MEYFFPQKTLYQPDFWRACEGATQKLRRGALCRLLLVEAQGKFKGHPEALLKTLQGASHYTARRLRWLMQDRGLPKPSLSGKRIVTWSHQKFPAFPTVHELPLQSTSEHGPRQMEAFTHAVRPQQNMYRLL